MVNLFTVHYQIDLITKKARIFTTLENAKEFENSIKDKCIKTSIRNYIGYKI